MMFDSILKCLFAFTFDFLFSIFVVTNLVAFVWRIIWDTQDLYLQSNLYINSLISVLVYFTLVTVVKFKQIKSLQAKKVASQSLDVKTDKSSAKNANKSAKKGWKKKLKLKLFILLFAFANINHWRGVWNFTIYYTNESVVGIFTIGSLSLMALVAMNRLCAIISVPFVLGKDSKKSAFQIEANSKSLKCYLSLDQEFQVKYSNKSNIYKFLFSHSASYVP